MAEFKGYRPIPAGSESNDETICKRVLNRSVRRLIEDLDVITVLDYSIENEFFSSVECRDIKDEEVTADKIRKVIEKVKEKGVDGYEQFKRLLKLARQEPLVKYLTDQESVIQKELQDEKAKQERVKKQIAKPASEKDLSNISECIGFNWEMLAPFLIGKNSTATVEQIKEDHKVTLQRVYALLCKWRAQTDDPSLAHLFHSMYQAGTSVKIDWNNIAYKLKVSIQDIQACMILPHEIQHMDQTSIQLYKQLLDEGYEVVYNIRVIVVGHKGAGKSTLTKRLLNEDVDISKQESTDGIEVHVNRCKVSLETRQWIISESDKKPSNASHRLVELLKSPANFTGSDLKKMEVNDDTVAEDLFANGRATENVGNDKEEVFTTNETKQRELVKDLQNTLQESIQMPTVDSKTADVSIWDFAGQTEFYDTHQVFLSKRAIYLVVTDMSKQVNDIVEDGNRNWKISEFVDFWLTSIYEFCGTKDSDGPPVILVGTFADKLKQVTNRSLILILKNDVVGQEQGAMTKF